VCPVLMPKRRIKIAQVSVVYTISAFEAFRQQQLHVDSVFSSCCFVKHQTAVTAQASVATCLLYVVVATQSPGGPAPDPPRIRLVFDPALWNDVLQGPGEHSGRGCCWGELHTVSTATPAAIDTDPLLLLKPLDSPERSVPFPDDYPGL
jgi:hypothetical protein